MGKFLDTEPYVPKGKFLDEEPDKRGDFLPSTIPGYMRFKFYSDKADSERANILNVAFQGTANAKSMLKSGNIARDYWMAQAGKYENLELKDFAKHPVKFVAGEAAQVTPYMVSSLDAGAKYGTVVGAGFATIAVLAGQIPPATFLPEEYFTVPLSFAVGFKTGSMIGVFNHMLKREGASFFGNMVEKGISEGTSRLLGMGVGTLNALLEMAQFNILSKPFKRTFSKVIRTKIGEFAIIQALGRYAKNLGINVLQEDLQEIVPLVAETIAGVVEENPNAVPTKEEWGQRLIETTARATAGMAVIGAPGGAVDIASSIRVERIIKNKEDAIKIQELAKKAETEIGDVELESQVKGEEIVKKVEQPIKRPRGQPKKSERQLVETGRWRSLMRKVNIIIPESLKKNFTLEEWNKIRRRFASKGEGDVAFDKWFQELKGLYPEIPAETDAEFLRLAIDQEAESVAWGEDREAELEEQLQEHIKENPEDADPNLEKEVQKEIEQEGWNDEEEIIEVLREGEKSDETSLASEEVGKDVEGIEVSQEGIKAEINESENLTSDSVDEIVDKNLEKEIAAMEEKQKKRLSLLDRAKLELANIIATIGAVQDAPEHIFDNKNNTLVLLKEDVASLKERIKSLQEEKITRRETVVLKNKIANIKRGIRQGVVGTKKAIKEVQNKVIRLIEQSEIDKKDVKKFLKTIRSIQTEEQFSKKIDTIMSRLEKAIESTKKDKLDKRIRKALRTTKPIKKGQRRVGQYDYTTNKLFDELRKIVNMTRSKSLEILDSLPEAENNIDLIKARFLSLKANGKFSSVEMYEQVLADINYLKSQGRLAKNEEDFLNLVNQQAKVQEVLDVLKVRKSDKKNIKTKIINLYRKGFAHIYSMLNSILDMKLAKKYDPELSESEKETATFHKVKEITKKIISIFKLSDENQAQEKLIDMAKKEYELVDKDGLTYELSKLDLIDIYNSLKNKLLTERYHNAFGAEQIDNLMGELTEEEEIFADYLQNVIQDYKEVFNKWNIEKTGRDNGTVENYWPATSERKIDIFDDFRSQSEIPSPMEERSKSSKIIPIPTNAWFKVMRHIEQGEHVRHLSRKYEELMRLFSDRKIKHDIISKYGEDVYKTLFEQIDNISLNKQTERLDAISGALGFLLNHWVTAKVAINPSVLVKQLISTGNYMENIDAYKWFKNFYAGLKSPKKTFDFMWENAPFLEARFHRGYSEAQAAAIRGADIMYSTKKRNWSKKLSAWVRSGDITAIIYGGYSFVQVKMEEGMSKEEAFKAFENETLKAQQSRLSSGRSQFQNSRNPLARLFLAFKNTTSQYLRKQVDAIISYHHGDISSKQLAKVLMIYTVIQPTLYAFTGVAIKQIFQGIGSLITGDEPDEYFAERAFAAIMTQLAVNPFAAIPLIDDLSEYAVRELTRQPTWKVFSTPLFDDLEMGIKKMSKEDKDMYDILEILAVPAEPGTGIPIRTWTRIFKYLFGESKSNNKLDII